MPTPADFRLMTEATGQRIAAALEALSGTPAAAAAARQNLDVYSTGETDAAIAQSTAMGTWTPKLYDYETYKCDLPECKYFKIGKLGVAEWHWNIPSGTNITISTMLQVRNLPFDLVYGGNVYFAGTTGNLGNLTLQGITSYVYPRPNWTGTMASGWFTGLAIGVYL